MNIFFEYIYILLWVFSFGSGEIEQLYVKSGSEVTLKCPFRGEVEPFVWRGPKNQTVYSINQNLNDLFKDQGTIQITGNYTAGEYNMVLQNYSDNQEGLYVCETVLQDKPLVYGIYVKAASKPSIILKNNDTLVNTIIGYEDSTLIIQCIVKDSEPQVNMSLKEGNNTLAISGSDEVIFTANASSELNLKYLTCVADNGFYTVQRMFQVFVNLLPRVQVNALPGTTVVEGHDVTLTCIYETNDNRSIGIKWFLNGREISNQNNYTLLIRAVTRHSAGFYACEVTNDAGKGSGRLKMLVAYQPFPVQNKSKFLFDAQLLKPTNISIAIESFPDPTAAWTESLGGKLSFWVVQKNHTVFTISSTILPLEESHIGKYGLILRNIAGSLHLQVELVSSAITINPNPVICNVSSAVTMKCRLFSEDKQIEFKSWTHVINTVFVRKMKGEVQGNLSMLHVNFCDYQDTGTYICSWKTPQKELSASASVQVHGQPILVSKTAVLNEMELHLDVHFYAVPNVIDVFWFEHNTLLSMHNGKLRNTIIKPNVYGTVVEMNGSSASLVFNKVELYKTGPFSCQVRNSFGIMETTFDSDLINDVIKQSMEKDIHLQMIYIAVATVSGCFLVSAIVICIIKKVRKGRIVVNTVSTTIESSLQENVDELHDIPANDATYEEIESSIYHDVNWRPYDLESEDSSIETSHSSNHLEMNSPTNYDSLQESTGESHDYKQIVEVLV